MYPRKFALYGGALMLLIGVIALIPAMAGSTLGLPVLRLETSYGLFFGLFPMNIVNKIVLIVFGVLGVGAANSKFRSLPLSILFSRAVLVVMGAAAILGLFPETNTMRGYWPLFGGEVWLHAFFAILGGYFGYALTAQVPKTAPRGGPNDFRSHVANT